MKKSRRQIVTRIFEVTGFGMVALNVLLYYGVYQPLQSQRQAQQKRQHDLRMESRDLQVRVEQLEKFQKAAPDAEKQLEDFTSNRIPSRRECYSTAAHLVQKMADASGVKTSSVGFHLDKVENDPLQRLGISISAQGSYTGLLKFAHALETANNFILIREFTITPMESGSLNLSLKTNLYLTP